MSKMIAVENRHCERSEAIQDGAGQGLTGPLHHPSLEPTRSADMRQPAVYIMASARNGTLYAGVTSNLPRRIYEHRTAARPGFTSRYACKLLVFYEWYADMPTAIAREKQIKAGSRKKKLALIEAMNPNWNDLHDGFA